MKPWNRALRGLVWLTQLGLSIMAPPVLCIWGCWWLRQRFSLGGWVMLLGIVLGLGGAMSAAAQFFRMMRRQSEKDARKAPPAFNDHV